MRLISTAERTDMASHIMVDIRTSSTADTTRISSHITADTTRISSMVDMIRASSMVVTTRAAIIHTAMEMIITTHITDSKKHIWKKRKIVSERLYIGIALFF